MKFASVAVRKYMHEKGQNVVTECLKLPLAQVWVAPRFYLQVEQKIYSYAVALKIVMDDIKIKLNELKRYSLSYEIYYTTFSSRDDDQIHNFGR